MATQSTHNLMLAAVQHHQAGRFAQAQGIYRQVLSQQPRNAEALHLLGLLAHQTGNHTAAVELIDRAIAIRPAAEFYLNAAEALRGLGQLDKAEAYLQSALRMDPKLPEAHNNLGSLYNDTGRLAQAIASFETALRLRPNYDQAMTNLGNVYEKHGKPGLAIAMHRK